jgi:hypothetical protein
MTTLLISAAINIGAGLLLNMLFPQEDQNQTQVGPRLNDLTVTSSAYGEVIPLHYGTVRVSGNIIWSPGVREVSNTVTQESGGKGGMFGGGGGSVSQTTFTYFADFAVALGEGVADDVLRIWGDSKLLYDKTGTGTAIGANFTFYNGSETQLPDPVIEADKGAGNVPAHRGMAYIVFNDLPLANFGNRIPNITVEITYNRSQTAPFQGFTLLAGSDIPGSTSGVDTENHFYLDPATDQLYTLGGGAGGGTALTRSSIVTRDMIDFGSGIGSGGIPQSGRHMNVCPNGFIYGQWSGTNYAIIRKININNFEEVATLGVDAASANPPTGFPNNGSYVGVLQQGDAELGVEPFNWLVISMSSTILGEHGYSIFEDQGTTFSHFKTDQSADIVPTSGRGGPVIMDPQNGRLWFTQENNSELRLFEVTATTEVGPTGPAFGTPIVTLVNTFTKGGVDIVGTADTEGWCILPDEDAVIISNGSSMLKFSAIDGTILATNLTQGFQSKNQWSDSGLFAYIDENIIAADGALIHTISTSDLTEITSQSTLLEGHADNLFTVYQRQAYDPRSHSIIYSRQNSSNPATDIIVRVFLDRGTGGGAQLDEVVRDINLQAGIPLADIDVTGISGEVVEGYSVSRQANARESLEPLQRAFLFEGVESDWTLKYILRGGASVATIPQKDIGSLTSGENDIPVKEIRQMEDELPRRAQVRYIERQTDYQQGTQFTQRILNPDPTSFSENDILLDLPIVFNGPTDPKQLSEKWLFTTWEERVSFDMDLPWSYIHLDPTDIFTITYQGDSRRLRLSSLEVGADLKLTTTSTQEDTSTFLSTVAADAGSGFTPQALSSGLPSKLLLLDLPILTAGDAAFQQFHRVYWGAAGYEASWPGSLLFRSQDGGQVFNEVSAVAQATPYGTVVGTIPAPLTTTTWDDVTTIDLKVTNGIDLFQSSTDLEVLNGANALAITTANGPEIIQFVNVTQLDAGTVRISRLLRGRRGTDAPAITDNHGTTEDFALLIQGGIITFTMPLALRNTVLAYRGVTLNSFIEDAPIEFFAYTGQDMIPYHVVEESAVTDGGGDVDIVWTRRTRFNGELEDETGIVPLNEQVESYEIDIVDPAGPTVLRTLTSAVESVSYTAAQQATDTAPATIEIEIYQMSGVVGRGRLHPTLSHTI